MSYLISSQALGEDLTIEEDQFSPLWPPNLKLRSAGNKQSLAVSFEDLAAVMPNPAIWLADQPKEMLQILHKAAKDVASEEFRELFENEKHLEVYVRITDLPIADSLRDIRHVLQSHCLAPAMLGQ